MHGHFVVFVVSFHTEVHCSDDESPELVRDGAYQTSGCAARTQGGVRPSELVGGVRPSEVGGGIRA